MCKKYPTMVDLAVNMSASGRAAVQRLRGVPSLANYAARASSLIPPKPDSSTLLVIGESHGPHLATLNYYIHSSSFTSKALVIDGSTGFCLAGSERLVTN